MYLDIYRIGYFGVGEKLGPGKVFCLTYLNTLLNRIDVFARIRVVLNGYTSYVKTKSSFCPSFLNSFSLRNEEVYQWKVWRRVRMRLSLSFFLYLSFSFPCNCCVNVRESGSLQLDVCIVRIVKICASWQSVFVSFTITYMHALKKHKILVINIFPLESFNGTIELKFKNPLVLSF